MNEKEASREGLVFHGATAKYWDENEVAKLKAKAKGIRALGFRAVVVQSGTSEWGGGSKLLYTEPLYRTYEWLESVKTYTPNHFIKAAEERCKKIMLEADKDQEEWDLRVADAKSKLANRGAK